MSERTKKLSQKLFGKRLKDLTREELAHFNSVRSKIYYEETRKKFTFEKSFVRKMYGQNKRFTTLSPEQRREYFRLKQRECRAKKKI